MLRCSGRIKSWELEWYDVCYVVNVAISVAISFYTEIDFNIRFTHVLFCFDWLHSANNIPFSQNFIAITILNNIFIY